MKKLVHHSSKFFATTPNYKTSKNLLGRGGIMPAAGFSRAKVTYQEVFVDEGGIHITGDEDVFLLPSNERKDVFEKIIIEEFKGEEMTFFNERKLVEPTTFNSSQMNKGEYDVLNQYLKKFISLCVFVISVFFAVWVNDSLKNSIGVFATLLAGFIIILSSISSILLFQMSAITLKNRLN